MNALTHGLTAAKILLPNETREEFESFRKRLFDDLAPQNEIECELVETIVQLLWRLRRVLALETALYRRRLQEHLVKQAEEAVRQLQSTESERLLESLKGTKVAVGNRQAHQDAERTLSSARAGLDEISLRLAGAFESSAQPLQNLWRHESALRRTLEKTLYQLERVQRMRAGEQVPVPSVVDVDVTLGESASVGTLS